MGVFYGSFWIGFAHNIFWYVRLQRFKKLIEFHEDDNTFRYHFKQIQYFLNFNKIKKVILSTTFHPVGTI